MDNADKIRKQLAKIKNFQGDIFRTIQGDLDLILDIHENIIGITLNSKKFFIGDKINPGLCWTSGGEQQFIPEINWGIEINFVASNIKAHKIDYNKNTELLKNIGADNCEEEVLLNEQLEIVDISIEWKSNGDIMFACIQVKL